MNITVEKFTRMKILVIINNSLDCFDMYQATGSMPQIDRKVVEIHLTDQQAKQINLQKGEIIESTTLQNY